MASADEAALARAVADVAQPLCGASEDLNPLIDLAGNARLVLIGEATHGTHEFYRLRAQLTKRLITEKGFCAVAVEADWPDAYRANRFTRARGADANAASALGDFRRFPAWMWRNADVLDFIGWLRSHNDRLGAPKKVGFYGLDLYSLHSSMSAVLRYLDRVDPEAAKRARARYACFDHMGADNDPQAYGYATSLGLSADCEQAVIAQLLDLQRERASILRRDGIALEDEQFAAEQNARVVVKAEEYYRSLFSGSGAANTSRGRKSSWNLRDTHMADTLDALLAHLGRRFVPPKIVVWAHNSHVGDARTTEMGDAGEINIGQLTRERHRGHAILIGFSTFSGTVTAASTWGGSAERKEVRPGLPGSYEELFHRTEVPRFVLPLRDLGELTGSLRERRLQRAIGVIYRPESERTSHYFETSLPSQFDAIIHVDQTRALEPLDLTAEWEGGDPPETFPSGI